MSSGQKVGKMFGVLVLGAGAILHSVDPASAQEKTNVGPGDQPTSAPTKATPKAPSSQPTTMPAVKEPEHCQLEFTFNRYDRERVQSIKTCLDGKSDEEVMKIINDAKNQTCASPFCGCWLG